MQHAHWFRQISSRLLLGFALTVSIMLGVMAVARVYLSELSQSMAQLPSTELPRLLKVQSLALGSENASTGLLQLLNLPRHKRIDVYTAVDARNRHMQSVIQTLQGQALTARSQQLIEQLAIARMMYLNNYSAMVETIEADDPIGAQQMLINQVHPRLREMQSLAEQLQTVEEAALTQTLQKLTLRFDSTLWFLSLLVLASLLAMLALAWAATRGVLSPLKQVVQVANRIAQGDYRMLGTNTGTHEIDQVIHAMNHMASAISQREGDVRRTAFTDALTKLPNRLAFLQWPHGLPNDAEMPTTGVVCVLDIARLRTINETLGFGAGDDIIVHTAKQLRKICPSDGLLAYVAGGRFAMWLPSLDVWTVAPIRKQIEIISTQPMTWHDQHLDVPLVVGYAHGHLNPTSKAPKLAPLLRNAEMAYGQAKSKVQASTWYEPAQEAARMEQLGLLSDLRTAAAENQLQMWLQPKVSAKTLQVLGCEALVRWVHPIRGFISPADFIPFAERTGAVVLLTQWMLNRAIQTLARWQAQRIHTYIAVNVSTCDLQDMQFVQMVSSAVAQHGIDPSTLVLEVTESGLMSDPAGAVRTLQALRDVGVQLSIDDFGTGYSSLAYLQSLPVHELKIDRSFVQNLDSKSGNHVLVAAMVSMAHGLGLSVTAEGVETDAEMQCLQALHVDTLQGYHLGKPMAEKAFEAWRPSLKALPPLATA